MNFLTDDSLGSDEKIPVETYLKFLICEISKNLIFNPKSLNSYGKLTIFSIKPVKRAAKQVFDKCLVSILIIVTFSSMQSHHFFTVFQNVDGRRRRYVSKTLYTRKGCPYLLRFLLS